MNDSAALRPVLDLIVLDCPDAMELGRFYSELLGWPMESGSDISFGEIEAAEPRVLDLGARRHDYQPSEDGGFRVYLDPAGHPFCLVR